MKCCQVYKVNEKYLVIPQGSVTGGPYIAIDPVISLPSGCTNNILGQAILTSLKNSKTDYKLPADYENSFDSFAGLKASGEKSYKQFIKRSNLCSVKLEENIEIVPFRNGGYSGPDKGFHTLDSRKLLLNKQTETKTLGEMIKNIFKEP